MNTFLTSRCRKIMIFLFWLVLWQTAALLINNSILMAGPREVGVALVRLIQEKSFWYSIAVSSVKISTGFFMAFWGGMFVGWLAFSRPLLREILAPAISFMKSVPVASFVILALIWMGSGRLSTLISFIVVFPVIYVNTIAGLDSTDKELLEMAQVFHIRGWRKGRCLHWPALLPYLSSSCKTALGMSWKSGIAAEVIGVPERTIGEQLYFSKIYLNTAELFAWTLVIILVSAGFEWLFLALLHRAGNRKPFFFPGGRTVSRAGALSVLHDRTYSPAGSLPFCPAFTLSITNLSKHFGNLEIFCRQTFSFSSETPTCIMAASGFGKTTLLRILLGLEQADEGEFTIVLSPNETSADFPGNGISVILSENEISAVFQENRLCEYLSPVDNLLLAVPGLSRKEAKQELSLLLPDECLNRPVSTLSGGMKRRAAIVRAVCFPGSIILMDEPFAGLDEETRLVAIAYILSRRRGRMLIFSSHQEEDAPNLGAKILHLDHVHSAQP